MIYKWIITWITLVVSRPSYFIMGFPIHEKSIFIHTWSRLQIINHHDILFGCYNCVWIITELQTHTQNYLETIPYLNKNSKQYRIPIFWRSGLPFLRLDMTRIHFSIYAVMRILPCTFMVAEYNPVMQAELLAWFTAYCKRDICTNNSLRVYSAFRKRSHPMYHCSQKSTTTDTQMIHCINQFSRVIHIKRISMA